MRVFAISDLHVDYVENRKWVEGLSQIDYLEDILILAGDITDIQLLFIKSIEIIRRCFSEVLFVPGNHDLWVRRSGESDSLTKFQELLALLKQLDIKTNPCLIHNVAFIPLLGWYDFSFGQPGKQLLAGWNDFNSCSWPDEWGPHEINQYFLSLNQLETEFEAETIISFSHFLPNIEVMPSYIPIERRYIYPVLGTNQLEKEVRRAGSDIHIYGHSHVNQDIILKGIRYVNNAFGYPHETRITRKKLKCVYDSSS